MIATKFTGVGDKHRGPPDDLPLDRRFLATSITSTQIHMLRPLLNALLVFSLCSCATSGDPSRGGLFGWSQSQADVRMAERRSELSVLEKKQAQLAREAAAAEREKKQVRARQGDGSRRMPDSAPPEELEPVKSVRIESIGGASTGSAPPLLPPTRPSMTLPSVPDPDQLLIKPPVEKPKF